MSSATLRLFATALGCLLATSSFAADRVALVIGNGAYKHATALPNPPNDARVVAKALGDVGFDVVEGIDLDRVSMERRLREFLNKASSAKVVMLFYAGHGMQVDGKNYLIPVDAQIETASDLNFGTVELDKVLASLDDPARANIIILDACRDNPMARSFASRTRSATVGAGLAAYTALGTGTLIAFSTAPGKVAADGQGANSPFTEGLVKHLRTPGLEVRQMLTRVRNDVARATGEKQVPWDNSSLRGDIYLAGPSRPDAGPAALAPPTSDEVLWSAIKDSAVVPLFEDFVQRFPSSARAAEAKAKLDTLKRNQVAAVTPATQAVAPPPRPPEKSNIAVASITGPPLPTAADRKGPVLTLLKKASASETAIVTPNVLGDPAAHRVPQVILGTNPAKLKKLPSGWLALGRDEVATIYDANGGIAATIALARLFDKTPSVDSGISFQRKIDDIHAAGDTLFFNVNCANTYSKVFKGQCGYVVAIDIGTQKMLWRSADITSIGQFVASGSVLYVGYGFTAEKDYVHVLDAATGKIIQKILVDSTPEKLELSGNQLRALSYNNILYDFRVN